MNIDLENFYPLSSTEEGEIKEGSHSEYGKLIAKYREKGNLAHEYKVGSILNCLNSDHFVKKLLLLNQNNEDILIITKAEGVRLGDFFRKILSDRNYTESELKLYFLALYHLVLILSYASYKLGFNHNDLHNVNIFI